MTVLKLLSDLKTVVEEETRELLLPVSIQKEDRGEQKYRAPEVHRMRLPNSADAKKYAPYVLIQAVDAEDAQTAGESPRSSVGVRMVAVVYHRSEPDGALALWELMDRIRTGLLRRSVIGGQFQLDLRRNVQQLVYDENLAPYFAGEISMVFGRTTPTREDVMQWL